MSDENKTGFQTGGYIDKKGTTGTALNDMPPGMDITNQKNADINDMPMKTPTTSGYSGD